MSSSLSSHLFASLLLLVVVAASVSTLPCTLWVITFGKTGCHLPSAPPTFLINATAETRNAFYAIASNSRLSKRDKESLIDDLIVQVDNPDVQDAYIAWKYELVMKRNKTAELRMQQISNMSTEAQTADASIQLLVESETMQKNEKCNQIRRIFCELDGEARAELRSIKGAVGPFRRGYASIACPCWGSCWKYFKKTSKTVDPTGLQMTTASTTKHPMEQQIIDEQWERILTEDK